jgi:hypothetical protein
VNEEYENPNPNGNCEAFFALWTVAWETTLHETCNLVDERHHIDWLTGVVDNDCVQIPSSDGGDLHVLVGCQVRGLAVLDLRVEFGCGAAEKEGHIFCSSIDGCEYMYTLKI